MKEETVAQQLPKPGVYTRRNALRQRADGNGTDNLEIYAKGRDTLVVETVALSSNGRDIIGKIKLAGEHDEFQPYATSLPIFNKGEWQIVEKPRPKPMPDGGRTHG